MSLSPNPIIILGMFRSGTSCLSNCLTELGYFLGGEEEYYPTDEFNPGGYYEMLPLMDINKRLLTSLGMQYYRNDPIPDNWRDVPGLPGYVDEIAGFMGKYFEGKRLWGYKEPRVSGLMPMYLEAFSRCGLDPVYAIAARFPLDVARSQRTHGPLPMLGERAVGVWLHYTLSSLRDTRGKKRAVVKYERVLQDPRRELETLMSLAGEKPSEESWVKAVGCVRLDWRHSAEKDSELDVWPPLVGEVERLCRTCAEDPEGLNAGAYDERVEELWSDWRRLNSIVKLEGMPHGKTIARCLTESGQKVIEEKYVPSKGWDTVRLELPVRKPTRVGLDLYQTPSYILIRRAQWIVDGVPRPMQLHPTPSGRMGKLDGVDRIAVLGPVAVEAISPAAQTSLAFEIEMLVQVEGWVTEEIIGYLRDEALRARTGSR